MNELVEKKIVEARESKGWTQSEVAEKLAMALNQTYSLRQYQKLEAGTFPKFKREIIKELEKILGVELYELIYESKSEQVGAELNTRSYISKHPISTKAFKIVQILKEKKITIAALERQLGLANATLKKAIERNSTLKDETLEKLSQLYPDINKEWLYYDIGPMIGQKQSFPLSNKTGKRIPFFDADATAGITETEMSPIHAPAGTIDVGDLLHDSQAAIRIYGNSMIPNYPPGCVVGLIKAVSFFIEPGEVYVIETRDRRMLKRLFYKEDNPESDYITCYSDNTLKFIGGARDGKLAYPPFDLHRQEIIHLFIVTGVIKRNSNSVIINRGI